MNRFSLALRQEFKNFTKIQPYNRSKQIPFLAAFSVATPLFIGLYFGNHSASLPAAIGGLVVLHYNASAPFALRMIKMISTSFGLIASYAIGLVFSFDPLVASFALGILSVIVHAINIKYKTPPPGSFFYIMIAAMACYLPYDLALVPYRVGMLAIGTICACFLAFIFSLIKYNSGDDVIQLTLFKEKSEVVTYVESLIVGICMFLAFFIGYAFHLENPVWIPISCLAVMQGVSRYHIWQRSYHRIIGTFIGVGICWILLTFYNSPIYIVCGIFIFQFLTELMITRHYAFAVVFITPLTILLAEFGQLSQLDVNEMIKYRLLDISIGCILGLVGGWFIHGNWRYQALKKGA